MTWLLIALLAVTGCDFKPSVRAIKSLRVSLATDVKGFDPTLAEDTYTQVAVRQVYQTLYQYSYATRPFQVEPLLARSLPTASEDGLTLTIPLRTDVVFQADPAFGDSTRFLRASDVVFSIHRVLDVKSRSPMHALLAKKIASITAPDEKTVKIALSKVDSRFVELLTMVPTSIIAPEVFAKYGEEFARRPVGTGPFRLKEWIRGQRLLFEKNKTYFNETFTSESGKRPQELPFLDEVRLDIYAESQPAWFNFLRGNLDIGGVPKEVFAAVLPDGRTLSQEYKMKGMASAAVSELDILYFGFNMTDPIVGAIPELRRAIAHGIDRDEKIRMFFAGRVDKALSPIPPGIFGSDLAREDPFPFDLSLARELAGRAAEKYRKMTNKPEIPPLTYDIATSSFQRQMAEAVARDLARIGIKVNIQSWSFPQLQDRIARGETQFFYQAWTPDLPDPENFLQLLYGPNRAPGPNASRFKNATFDDLYEKMAALPDGDERLAIIGQMRDVLVKEVPWIWLGHRISTPIHHAWVKHYSPNPLVPGAFKYLDLDVSLRTKTIASFQ